MCFAYTAIRIKRSQERKRRYEEEELRPSHGQTGRNRITSCLPTNRPEPRLYASQNPFAQVPYLGPRSSRKEDGMHFLRRQLLRTLSFAFGSSFILGRNQLAIAAQTAVQPKTSPLPPGAAVRDAIAEGTEMEKVIGIGGFFFRAKDPKALGLWYQQHLGISLIPSSEGDPVWEQEAGPTAFAPFPETSKYFGDAQKVWMLNFRVRDLDKMAAQLQAAGIAVKIDAQSYPNGRFARLHDPEGNPIELWQPKGPDTKG